MNTEQREEIKRHFGVVAEALKSDILQIAEGHAIFLFMQPDRPDEPDRRERPN